MTFMNMNTEKNTVKNELDLGRAIKDLRLSKELTQDQLARAAGVSRAFVIGLEKGNKPGAELRRVLRVIRALDQQLTIEQSDTQDFNSALQQLFGRK
jgi:transcriptional regulator with XRE-family HTH domain